ncbi:hypothetical protein [Micromonospora sp. NPDC049891]|uniref:hypothetical protein n=1 Tax=Micromonospora sp. NPDC049891 TaxID=3155655 RepID=UPI0033D7695E
MTTLPATRVAAAPAVQPKTKAASRPTYRPSKGDTSLGRVVTVIFVANGVAGLAGYALSQLT